MVAQADCADGWLTARGALAGSLEWLVAGVAGSAGAADDLEFRVNTTRPIVADRGCRREGLYFL